MLLAHKIRLTLTPDQEVSFRQAYGTSRERWNWALDEWNKQYTAGEKSNANDLKKQFNAVKYESFPWMKDMHRESHSQPFSNLNSAWSRFFTEVKAGKKANAPVFKWKGKSKDSFFVAYDKFRVESFIASVPKVGAVVLTEELRSLGKIFVGTVSRTANKWFLSVQVEVPDSESTRFRTSENTFDVDLGIKICGSDLLRADQGYPSSKLCSGCGWKNGALQRKDREWVCHECGVVHDRDINAAINLNKLPVASSSERKNIGKVTPVRYQTKPVRNSGQELTVNTLVHM